MPREKSEMTKNNKQIGIRLIPRHKDEWVRLGGVKWLREVLQKSIDKAKNDV
jgi:hypothetical protein